MPKIEVVYCRELEGASPVIDWLTNRRTVPHLAAVKLLERIERLQLLGHELRRPESDFLRDGIHELRVKHLRVNYRLLYFFHHWQTRNAARQQCAVLAHGITKEQEVPSRDIDVALRRMSAFRKDPVAHTHVIADQ